MLSVSQTSSYPDCPTPFNLADYVLTAGRQTPDKIALEICGSETSEAYTFAEIEALVRRIAGALQYHGVKPQTRVLMRLGNDLSFPVTYLATLWLGAVPVPTSAQLTQPEIDKITQELDPDLTVCAGQLPVPKAVKCLLWSDLREHHVEDTPAPHLGDPERLGYIIFTSGTTQGPRGVCHAHRAIWARRMMFDGWYGLLQTDRLMHAGAFNWTYTLGTGLMDPWTMGATALIPAADTRAVDLFSYLNKYDATIFAGAPGVYRQMLKKKYIPKLTTLRHGLSAGEKLTPALKQTWTNRTGVDVHEALGMSECSTFISGSPENPAEDTCAGWPQPGRRIAVLDEAGHPVLRETAGTLAIHRSDPGLFLGYLDAPHAAGDWFLTGDTVSMGENGAITFLGRDDDMLNAGGFRVSPLEVEATFVGLDEVQDAAAVAYSPKADTTVIALIYTSNLPIREEVLRAHAEQMLARYKQPRLYIHRDVLPKGGNGKLNRKALRLALEKTNGQA